MSANVALTDTFDQWRVKTNEVVVMTQADGMSNFIKVLDTTNSTSNTTGSIITAGGVGIAKSAVIGENLRIHGNLITDGDTTISGNLIFGDATTDQVTFTADINSSLIPNANLTFNIGNTTMQWANAWVGHAGITQKTDSGKPALSVTSQDVDELAVSITASQTTADVLDIAADSVTTGKVIDITSDALTTGSALYIDSDSAATDTRSIAEIIQNHASATGSTALTVRADAGRGLFVDADLAAGGYALEIDSEQTTTNTAKIASVGTSGTMLEISHVGTLTGKVIDLTADSATTGTGFFMSMDGLTSGKAIDVTTSGVLTGKVIDITADAATTGTGINMSMDGLTTGSAIAVDSDSSSTGTRNIASITQNHASAVNATTLALVADAGRGLFIDSNLAAGGYALEVDAEITTTNTAKIAAISTSGTTLEIASAGVLTGKVIDITADAATTGTGIFMSMDGLTSGKAIDVTTSGTLTGKVIDITADAATTGTGINMSMDGLTTGSALAIDSDSSSTGTRSIASIIQNHSSATGATALALQADAGRGLFIDTNLAAGGYSFEIDAEQNTTNTAKIAAVSTSGTTLEISSVGVLTGKVIDITADAATTGTGINMSMDGLTTGAALAIDSNSADTGTRTLVTIHNNHASATAAVPLVVTQDSTNCVAKFVGTSTIIVPVGTSSNRGPAVQGGIRYNTTTSGFEGYSGSTWAGLGGLIDVDQDTKILAETSAGADNDDLDFYTAGTKRMSIDQAGVLTHGVDGTGYDVQFFGDTAGRSLLWDQSADELIVTGKITSKHGHAYHNATHASIAFGM